MDFTRSDALHPGKCVLGEVQKTDVLLQSALSAVVSSVKRTRVSIPIAATDRKDPKLLLCATRICTVVV